MNSSQLKSYLTGLVLGDGIIDKGTQKRAFYITTITKDWAEKIYNDIKSCTNFKINLIEKESYTDKDKVNHKKSYTISIKAHPYFTKIYHYFYDDYRKRIIHIKALNSLDWNGWANWFMSDGYIVRVGLKSGKIKDRRVQLCTDRYKLSDIQLLKDFLLKKYNLDTTIIKRYNTHRLNFKLESAQQFLLSISPFVTNSLLYKLDMCYDYQPSWMHNEYYHLMKNIHERQNSLIRV